MIRFVTRVLAIAGKEVLHVRRDVRTLYLALGMPVVLLVLFGYGVSFDLGEIPILVVDQDDTEASRALVQRMTAAGEMIEVARVSDPSEVAARFERGEGSAALIVPRGFARDLGAGRPTSVQLLVDGSDNATATQVIAKADALLASAGAALTIGALRSPGAATPPIEARVTTWFNPGGRSALFLVPGLTAYVLAIVAVLLTALTIAREWERGSMQQLFATPVSRVEIVIGKLLPYLALGVVAALLVLASGAWLFDVPMRGDPAVLALASLLFLLGMLGQGLLISVIARNQMVATQVATMSSMLPSMLLSGFMFPIENMPLPLQAISSVVPARYFVDALRGVLLRGNGAAELWRDLVALAVFAIAVLALATLRFRRQLA
ncbi:MAG: ABC transporter permease [Myxococcota bacterium]|nr:ABC transporter permease [Myxococcota bacterium]